MDAGASPLGLHAPRPVWLAAVGQVDSLVTMEFGIREHARDGAVLPVHALRNKALLPVSAKKLDPLLQLLGDGRRACIGSIAVDGVHNIRLLALCSVLLRRCFLGDRAVPACRRRSQVLPLIPRLATLFLVGSTLLVIVT